MVQILPASKVGSFGQALAGFGQGALESLGEQIPKRMEERRLSQGLDQLNRESANLSPSEYLIRLESIPGVSAEGKRQLSEAKQREHFLNAYKSAPDLEARKKKEVYEKFIEKGEKPSPVEQTPSPSLAKAEDFAKVQEGYIPPTREEIIANAQKLIAANPGLYNGDPNLAIAEAEKQAVSEEKRALAEQSKYQNLTAIQDNVVKRLKEHASGLSVQIPANVYSKIEDKAIQATKPKKDGGEGLTEQQAMKKYGAEADQVSREYANASSIGSWGITAKPAKSTLTTIKSLQKQFEARGDTQNFADTLISDSKLSPMFAYALAEPVSRSKQANQVLNKVNPLSIFKLPEQYKNVNIGDLKEKATLDIAERLAPLIGDASPLAVAYELGKKNYDPSVFLQYLIDHTDELNLRKNQIDQLSKPQGAIGTMNDWWLSSFSGIN